MPNICSKFALEYDSICNISKSTFMRIGERFDTMMTNYNLFTVLNI